MSRTIKKHVRTNPITKTRTIRYEKPWLNRMGESTGAGLPVTLLAIAGLLGLADTLTKGHDENYEEACARRDAQPKKSAKPELVILGLAGITFIGLMAYIIAMAFMG